ncbi:MAG: ImmA/IrrE family metallo-endopeptidase [Azoarcus sp.]|jgi:Zn-dependent peptidase ImmA (M78 family)|nr:ImmA/IrrE family metallo-endopeptidase [Azoarcus sp.]
MSIDELDIQQKARDFIKQVDISNIRDDLSPYLTAAKVKLHFEKLNEGESGYTFTKSDGTHSVTVNSLETPERQRFTICHEIAHIVLGLPSSHDGIPAWGFAKRDVNEIMCDMFAAELLMPYKLWSDIVPNEEPSLELIQKMAGYFKASFPAAASRYASLCEIPCAFVTMNRGNVLYASRSNALRQARAWISPRSVIPVGSVASRLRCLGKNSTETGSVAQDVWFDNWENGYDMWELSRHYADTDTTISLLWFGLEDLPDVPETDRFGVGVRNYDGLAELTGELPWPGRQKRR